MWTLLHSCAYIEPIEVSFGVVSGVGPGIHVLDGGLHAPKGRGCLGIFSEFVPHWFEGQNDYFLHRNVFDSYVKRLTVFPYGQDIVGTYVSLAFQRYNQVQDWSGGLQNICKNVTLISGTDCHIFGHSSKASRVPWNKVFHWKMFLEQITWRNKSTCGDFTVVRYPPRSEYVFATT